MERTFVKIVKGNYVAWARDGKIQSAIIDAEMMETTGGVTIVGWWAETPKREEFIADMKMMGYDF